MAELGPRSAKAPLWRFWLLPTFVAVAFGAGPRVLIGADPQETAAQPTVLEAGSSVRRKLVPREAHRYSVLVQRGEYFRVSVEQLGIDVELSLLSPGGDDLIVMDTPTNDRGSEEASWVAPSDGLYGVRVAAFDAPFAGSYEIRLSERRPARAEDEVRLQAEANLAQGYRLAEKEDAPSRLLSLDKLSRAIDLWRSLGDPRNEALSHFSLARARLARRELKDAIEEFGFALERFREAGDENGVANTLYNLGTSEFRAKLMGAALEHLQESLREEQRLGNGYMESEATEYIALVHDGMGEKDEALRWHERALRLMESSGNRRGIYRVVNNIGFIHEDLGQRQQALEAYSRALELGRAMGNATGVGRVLENLGRVLIALGERDRGIQFLSEALAVFLKLENTREQGVILMTMGRSISEDEPQRAQELLRRALTLVAGSDPRMEGLVRNTLGEAQVNGGVPAEAVMNFEEARVLFEKAQDPFARDMVLRNLGVAQFRAGEREKGLDALARALALARAAGDRFGEFRALFARAQVRQVQGDLEGARGDADLALPLLEPLRADVSNVDLKTSYSGILHRYYAFHVDLLMEMHRHEPGQGYDARALEVSEQGRARALIDTLDAGRRGVLEKADPGLIQVKQSLERQISRGSSASTAGGEPGEKVTAVRDSAELESLWARYRDVERSIRAASPRYAELVQPRVSTLEEIQKTALGPGAVLLEYALGEEKSFLWAITAGSFSSFELPRRIEVENDVRVLYGLIQSWNERPLGETAAQRKARVEKADADYREAAASLSRTLLGPAAGVLGRNRLLIVPDGALHYVPFAALPAPEAEEPLIVRHEIVTLPSASSLAVLRSEVAGRAAGVKTLAVLADAVFEKDDERVTGRRSLTAPPGVATGSPSRVDGARHQSLLRSAADVGLGGQEPRIARLPFTRREARGILRLVPAAERMEALGFDASLTTVMSPELSTYRFVHFATHGFLDSLHPELSGLVLSLVDREGRDQPGFLSAADVFNLKLPADLVVLSGCQTALGKEIKGEGLVGLTRAFMYAGAPRVVASLWKVDDVATAELMKRFYESMLGREGRRPAAALRAAQVSMLREGRWKAPYYWAAFVLQGEWK